jgi:hypothetical protein
VGRAPSQSQFHSRPEVPNYSVSGFWSPTRPTTSSPARSSREAVLKPPTSYYKIGTFRRETMENTTTSLLLALCCSKCDTIAVDPGRYYEMASFSRSA